MSQHLSRFWRSPSIRRLVHHSRPKSLSRGSPTEYEITCSIHEHPIHIATRLRALIPGYNIQFNDPGPFWQLVTKGWHIISISNPSDNTTTYSLYQPESDLPADTTKISDKAPRSFFFEKLHRPGDLYTRGIPA